MIYGAMPTMPVSDLRNAQAGVIAMLRATPLLLTKDGRSAGVLVHPRVWNYLVEIYDKARAAGLLEIDPAQLRDWAEVEQEFFSKEPGHVEQTSHA